MHNRLLRWLVGSAPEVVGIYWGDRGTCAVYETEHGQRFVAYDAAIQQTDSSAWETAMRRLEVISGISRRDMCLSIALNADDVFLRSMTVPQGLSDAQLGQVAIVEAVANLPVPPEEICLDFVRSNAAQGADEMVSLAFCRREKMDELLACAEEIGVSAWIVDRDVQAIHDAIQAWWPEKNGELHYPFAVFLTDVSPRLLICLDPVAIEVYPIGSYATTLSEEITSCWTRCSMSRALPVAKLTRIVVVGDALNTMTDGLTELTEGTGIEVTHYQDARQAEAVVNDPVPPSETLLIAMGMAQRKLS